MCPPVSDQSATRSSRFATYLVKVDGSVQRAKRVLLAFISSLLLVLPGFPTLVQAGSVPTSVSGLSVTPNPMTGGETAQYTITFTTSASGALPGGSGTITVGLPQGQGFPAQTQDWQVNGQAPAAVSAQGSGSSTSIVLTVSANIAASSPVSVVAVNATNPAAGAYDLAVSTSADTQAVNASYTIGASANGSGTLQVSPPAVTAGSTGQSFVFTYTAAAGGLSNGKVEIAVPVTWPQPSTTTSNAGFASASAGSVTVAENMILVSQVSLAGGQTLNVTYGDKNQGGPGVTVPTAAATATFTAREASTATGNLTALGASPTVQVTAGQATQLVFTTVPTGAAAGSPLATQPRVTVEDAYGNTVQSSASIDLSIASGTGTSGARLSCTANPLAATAGVASFSGCSIDTAGTGYALTATAGGLESATSAPAFAITDAALQITTPAGLPQATTNTPYSLQLQATGGSGNYSWALASGTLPSGLSLSTSGLISGTPVVGDSGVTRSLGLQVTDIGAGTTATLDATIHVVGSQVQNPQLQVSDPTADASGATYALTFTTSSVGALTSSQPGSGITLTAPAGTEFPSAPSDYTVEAGGAPVTISSVNFFGNGGSIYLGGNGTIIAASTQVTVTIAGVGNPPVASPADELQVQTTGDPGTATAADPITAVVLPAQLAGSTLSVAPDPIIFDVNGSSSPQATADVTLQDANGTPVVGDVVALSLSGPGYGYSWNATPSTAPTDSSGVASFTLNSSGGDQGGTLLVIATDQSSGQFIGGIAVPVYAYLFTFSGQDYPGSLATIGGSGLPASAAVTAASLGGQTLTLSGTCATDAQGDLSGCDFVVPTMATGQGYPLLLTIGGVGFSQNFGVGPIPAGVPATLQMVSGDQQQAAVGTAFASPLVVTVDDAGGSPVGSGVAVTFAAPASGAGATFPGGATSATVQTDGSGQATSPTLTANGSAGSYQVTASAQGTDSVFFTLTNTTGQAGSLQATAGDGQIQVVGQPFSQDLEVTIRDAGGNPVSGAPVVFTAPTSGPSVTFSGASGPTDTVPTGQNGVAEVQVTASGATGAYEVTASVPGVSETAIFHLRNATTVLQNCDDQSLQTAFAEGGYVAFACSGTIQLTKTLVVPASLQVTLDGQGADVWLQAPPVPLAGSSQSNAAGWTERVFDVEGGKLTLLDVSVSGGSVQGAMGQDGQNGPPGMDGQNGAGSSGQNGAPGLDGAAGSSAQGGAMFIAAGSQVTISGGTFADNVANGGPGGAGGLGGAGGNGGGGGSQTAGGYGGDGGWGGSGGIGGAAQGGAIYNLGTLTLYNVLFNQNMAQGGTGGAGNSGGPGGQGGLGAAGQAGNPGVTANCSGATGGDMGLNGGPGGPGGLGGKAGVGGMGGAAAGGAIYNLGTLTVTGGDFEGNQALGGTGGGERNAGLNHGGIAGLGGLGGSGGPGGNIIATNRCKKFGKAGSGGQGGTGGASGWSAQGGAGGAGGAGGTAQGGAIWDGASLALEGTTFGAGMGNEARGGAGGAGGNGGSAADGLKAFGGGGAQGGCLGSYEAFQGSSILDCYSWESYFFGSPGKSGQSAAKSLGAAGGVGGQGGDGGGAQGGAIYATDTAALQEVGLTFGGPAGPNSAANLSTGGAAGQGGLGGYSKCAVFTNPSGPDSLECSGSNIYAKRAQSNGGGSAGDGSGVNFYQEGQQVSLVITTAALPGGVAGDFYATMLQATDGVGPYQWSWQGDTPPGLSLDPTYGSIYEVSATAAGMYFFTVTVTDAIGETASGIFSVDIVPAAAGAIAGGDVVSGSSNATSSTVNGSATAGGQNTSTPDTSATASGGEGTVAVTSYNVDPVGAPTFQSSGQYIDIAMSMPAVGGFQSLTATECGVAAGSTVEWSPDGTTWEAVNPQSYDAQTGCITLGPLNGLSAPTIAQLTGTVFAVAGPTTAVGTGDRLTFSPATLATGGSLNPGDTAVTDVTVSNAQGAAIPWATIYLSLASGALGRATAEGVALTGSPQAFTADSSGQIAVTYTAPANPPASGIDRIDAQSDQSATPAVSASAAYNFAAPVLTPASITGSVSPTQVAGGETATVSGYVSDAGGGPIQNAIVDITASGGTLGRQGLGTIRMTTLADGSYSATWTSPSGGGAATISVSVEGTASPVTVAMLITPPGVTVTGSQSASALSGTATASSGGALGGTTGTASGGSGTLTVADFSADPEGALTFIGDGTYFDVYLSAGNTFTSLRLVQCGAPDADAVYWWDAVPGSSEGAWKAVPASALQFGAPGQGCVTITLTGATHPSLSDLSGTAFAAGTIPSSGSGSSGTSGGTITASPGSVGSAGGNLSTADGDFTMTLAPGALAPGQTLSVQESPAPKAGLPPDMTALTSTFTLTGGTLSMPQTATITYAASALGGFPPDRLAVYALSQDGRWTFLPTAVDGSADTLSVHVMGPESLVALLASAKLVDVPSGYWASGYIDQLLADGVVAGLPGGLFRPGATLTRAQFVKMLVLALGIAPASSGETPFDDVSPQAWFAPYVAAALQAGIAKGVTATAFQPDAPVSREEMAVLLARAFGLKGSQPLTFADRGKIGSWALAGVEAAVQAGLMSGLPGGRFVPQGDATRAQAAKAIAEALARLAP